MNYQQFFNVGVRHILRAGPAYTKELHEGAECTVARYLKDDGTACFLGANLLEVMTAPQVRKLADVSPDSYTYNRVYKKLGAHADDREFILACMAAHDDVTFTHMAEPDTWRMEFIGFCRKIATKWGLDTALLDA